jgi:RimJ/RimL family protein N-acetyltransferase
LLPLEGHRVRLLPRDRTDEQFLGRLSQLPEVARFVGALTLGPKAPQAYVFIILERDTPVGVAALVRCKALGERDWEIVSVLIPPARGRGLAFEACKVLARWAFDSCGLSRIIACVDTENAAGHALARRLGMSELCKRPAYDQTVYVALRGRAV